MKSSQVRRHLADPHELVVHIAVRASLRCALRVRPLHVVATESKQ
jgi:hypothetical protein